MRVLAVLLLVILAGCAAKEKRSWQVTLEPAAITVRR